MPRRVCCSPFRMLALRRGIACAVAFSVLAGPASSMASSADGQNSPLVSLSLGAISMSFETPPSKLVVVRLKNGGYVRGEVLEQVPGQFVRVRTNKGKELRFEADEIETIEEQPKERGENATSFENAVESDSSSGTADSTEAGASNPVRIELESTGDREVRLVRMVRYRVARFGNTTYSSSSFEELCKSPCSVVVHKKRMGLYLHSDGTPISKELELEGASDVRLKVRPGVSKLYTRGVYVLSTAVPLFIAGVCMWLLGPTVAPPSAPKPLVGGGVAGTILGALGLGGAVPTMIFGSNRVVEREDR